MSNVNPNTGIRFGVITANDVPELHQEIMDNGQNETFEEFKRHNPNEVEWELYEEDCDTYSYKKGDEEYLLFIPWRHTTYMGNAITPNRECPMSMFPLRAECRRSELRRSRNRRI